MRITLLIIVILIFYSCNSIAKGVYQSNEDFLAEVFNSTIPKVKSLWLTKKIKPKAKLILGNKPSQLRIRYWKKDKKTAWILEEVGKEKKITFGIVIEDHKIKQFKVLAFRESRGWEIEKPFYTEQFINISLQSDLYLDKHIDGISGATLSVRASEKMARLALLFNKNVSHGK